MQSNLHLEKLFMIYLVVLDKTIFLLINFSRDSWCSGQFLLHIFLINKNTFLCVFPELKHFKERDTSQHLKCFYNYSNRNLVQKLHVTAVKWHFWTIFNKKGNFVIVMPLRKVYFWMKHFHLLDKFENLKVF